MLKLMLLPNIERFQRLIAQSCGDVILHLPDNTRCNLKQDHTAVQLLGALGPGKNGLDISLSDPNDLPAFLQYLMEAAHC